MEQIQKDGQMIEYVIIFILIWLVFGAVLLMRNALTDYNDRHSRKVHHEQAD